MKKFLSILLFTFCCSAYGQFTPPANAAFLYDGTSWIAASTTDTVGAISFTPPSIAMYCYNSTLGQWVPATSTCFGGGGGGGGVSQIIAGTNITISPVGGTGVVTVNATGAISGVTGNPGEGVGFSAPNVPVGIDLTVGGGFAPPLNTSIVPTPWTSLQIPAAGWSAMFTYGDSIPNGVGAVVGSTPYKSDSYPGIMAAFIGVTPVTSGGTWTNTAIGGDMWPDIVKKVFNTANPTYGDTTLYDTEGGLNEADVKGQGPYDFVSQSAHIASLTFLGIIASHKFMAAAATPATNWSLDTTYTTSALQSNTQNAVQTFTITNYPASAPQLYFWYRVFDPGTTACCGSFSVQTDAQAVVNLSAFSSPGVATLNGATDSIFSAAITNPIGAGTHTISVKVLSATGTAGSNMVSAFGVGYAPFVPVSTTFSVAGGITTFAFTGGVVNDYVAGMPILISGCSTTNGRMLNAQYLPVLSAGLTSTSLSINTSGIAGYPTTLGSTTDACGVISTTPTVIGSSVSRNFPGANDVHDDTDQYNLLISHDIRNLQSAGFYNLRYVNCRNFWTNSIADMKGIGDGHHPNPGGHAELAACHLGPVSTVEVPPLRAPKPVLRPITTAELGGFAMASPTDTVIDIASTIAGNFYLPPTGITALNKCYDIFSDGAAAVTLASPTTGLGSAFGQILTNHSGLRVCQPSTNVWNVDGPPLNATVRKCTNTAATTLTLGQTDDCIVKTGSAALAITFPVPALAGVVYTLSTQSLTNPITFVNGGAEITSQIIGPGSGAQVLIDSTGVAHILGNGREGDFHSCVQMPQTYTLLLGDECVNYTSVLTGTLTLPTTWGVVKRFSVSNTNGATTALSITGATTGNANSVKVATGQTVWLEGGPSGEWHTIGEWSNSTPNTSATGGTGISAVTCATASCTNRRGTYSMTATSFTAGTLLTLVWPTTTTPYNCTAVQNDGNITEQISHGVATATGMTISAGVSIASGTVAVDYQCVP